MVGPITRNINMRVLYYESDERLVARVTALLKPFNMRVHHSKTLLATLDILEDSIFNLVLMGGDYASAFDALAQLLQRHPRTPVVLLTEKCVSAELLPAISMGAQDVLSLQSGDENSVGLKCCFAVERHRLRLERVLVDPSLREDDTGEWNLASLKNSTQEIKRAAELYARHTLSIDLLAK